MVNKIQILVLEDNEIFQKQFLEIAEKHAFEVLGLSKTAKDLLQQIDQKKPQVVILDLVIPEEDILDLIQNIKNLYPDLPLIACSSLKEENVVTRILEAGCFDYIFKPFKENQLVESIKKSVA